MYLNLNDKEIDRELARIVQDMQRLGIKASKTDAIRYLLNIKRQGKKTDRKWKNIIG